MPAHTHTPLAQPGSGAHDENEYEDLLGLWSDLETALSWLLLHPRLVEDFPAKLRQCDRWLQDLVAHDTDAALYLMFQLAATSTVGYSASHALVCGTLCHIMARELKLPSIERDSLVRAAFTMNIGMTALQDELAHQRERPTAAQQRVIDAHPRLGMELLEELGIRDEVWLEVVGQHHAAAADGETRTAPLRLLGAEGRLCRILATIDRYAAMISPRKSRIGRSSTDSVRAIVSQEVVDQSDEVGFALVRRVGLCPPGTFVRLDNGDTAVVLRHGDRPMYPLVASLLDRHGGQLARPALHHTGTGKPRIQSALARSAVPLELNHRTMVRLGLYAARRGHGLGA